MQSVAYFFLILLMFLASPTSAAAQAQPFTLRYG